MTAPHLIQPMRYLPAFLHTLDARFSKEGRLVYLERVYLFACQVRGEIGWTVLCPYTGETMATRNSMRDAVTVARGLWAPVKVTHDPIAPGIRGYLETGCAVPIMDAYTAWLREGGKCTVCHNPVPWGGGDPNHVYTRGQCTAANRSEHTNIDYIHRECHDLFTDNKIDAAPFKAAATARGFKPEGVHLIGKLANKGHGWCTTCGEPFGKGASPYEDDGRKHHKTCPPPSTVNGWEPGLVNVQWRDNQ